MSQMSDVIAVSFSFQDHFIQTIWDARVTLSIYILCRPLTFCTEPVRIIGGCGKRWRSPVECWQHLTVFRHLLPVRLCYAILFLLGTSSAGYGLGVPPRPTRLRAGLR